MWYFVFAFLGMLGGAFCVYIATEKKRKALHHERLHVDAQTDRNRQSLVDLERRGLELEQFSAAKTHEIERQVTEKRAEIEQHAAAKQAEIEESRIAWSAEQGKSEARLKEIAERLAAERQEFDDRVVSYADLSNENALLKRDIRNLAVQMRKLQMDRDSQRCDQTTLDERCAALATRYLKDNVKWIAASLTPNNYAASKDRLQDVIARCRAIGFNISESTEAELMRELKHDYELVVRAAYEREEQARIRAQIREEQMREREIERAKKEAEYEKEMIAIALAKALAEAHDKHSEEVERLKAMLAEAEEKSQRAVSQAQLTKAGNIYVISNIGSFGEGVFKVGMTRRLEPYERIKELGDASVPFPFDIHMMIATEDAPKLECALHHALHLQRVNRVNPNKEFFKTDIESIYELVKQHHGEVQYVADAEALQYRQSLTMSEEDQEFIEHAFEEAGALDDEEEEASIEA